MELTHGGDWAGYRAKFGRDALDFSANVSPLGLPEGVAQAIVNALPTADRYPDPLCERPIFRLVLAKSRTALPAPTFACAALGCEVEYFFLKEENDFEITEELLSALHETIDMVFLCQPNNPTGQIVTSDFLEKLLKKCRACHATPVIDECFLDFLPEHENRTAKRFLAQFPELVILKAFTKLYAMAGVRLGYVLSGDEKLLENMREAGQPWAVSSLAQAAGVAALDETEYADRVRSLIARERPRMIASLRSLGLRVLEGQANFLLFKAPEDFGERLKEKGAVVRGCANYPGLDNTWYRTAVRTPEENEKLLKIMREVLK
ncbi:pyridoxal phosphate-dependent aminotransferase [Hominenteromicrobium sp.]|uniref:pyridoxal phosphate-dependent aminotransferase n=1 Tax=Hominenteromicrobium sp. TaxID=3073581 RepID=UPI00399C09FA